jgi:hypothetical protein
MHSQRAVLLAGAERVKKQQTNERSQDLIFFPVKATPNPDWHKTVHGNEQAI